MAGAAQVYTGTVTISESVPVTVTIKEITVSRKTFIQSVWLSCANTTVPVGIIFSKKMTGGAYEVVANYTSNLIGNDTYNLLCIASVGDGTYIYGEPFHTSTDVKIEIISSGGGAGNVTLYWTIEYDIAPDMVASVYNGTGATDDVDLSARSLVVDNDTNNAVLFRSLGGNGNGLLCIGNGSGGGLYCSGGATGHGVRVVGGGTSGNGINVSTTDGHGIAIANLGATKDGINIASSRHGIVCASGGVGGVGFYTLGSGTGAGLFCVGGANGSGVQITGGGTSGNAIDIFTTDGNGILIVAGGDNSAINVQATGTADTIVVLSEDVSALSLFAEEYGIRSVGSLAGAYFSGGDGVEHPETGVGLKIEGKGTDNGAEILGGGTSGDGINISTIDGHGIAIVGLGATKDAINMAGARHGLVSEGYNGNGALIRSMGGGGYGIYCLGHDTGYGAYFVSGSGASGDGIRMQALSTNGSGLTLVGKGNLPGFYTVGGATGQGILAQAAGADAVKFEATAGTGSGFKCMASGGHGSYFLGGGVGHGFKAEGGTTNGNGIYALGVTNGNGVFFAGNGTGHGGYYLSGAGATGDGFRVESRAVSGNGLYMLGKGTGSGIVAVKGASGYDAVANEWTHTPITIANMDRAFKLAMADIQPSNAFKLYVY